jgi:hypothetical protein
MLPFIDPRQLFFVLRWASIRGHADIVERLLKDPRVNPADKNNEAI